MKILSGLIIGLGVVLRVVVYLQNRNLILDEANVARNIYERGFAELALPLNYDQYAPPVFLWITKLNSWLFGFSEYVLRLYPLVAGIASLFIFYAILKKLVSWRSTWYALFLLAAVPFFIRYSSELKQYMPDAFIGLLLIWLALITEVEKRTAKRFVFIWVIAGSIAIWSSMPSVFVLTGVGLYYLFLIAERKAWEKFGALALVCSCWLMQFLFYYFTILRPESDLAPLQNFHQAGFLYATPSNIGEWKHNWFVVSDLLLQLCNWSFALYLNSVLFVVACFFFFLKDKAKGLLLIAPVITVLLAAALNLFSLIPRVTLFIVPIIVLVITYGLEQLFKLKNTTWQIVVAGITVICAIGGNGVNMLWKPFKMEQLTEAMDYLKEKSMEGDDVSFYHACGPALIYYTQIHPKKKNWESYKTANVLKWNTSYDSLAKNLHITKPFGFVFTNGTDEQVKEIFLSLNKYLQSVDSLNKPYVKTYIFISTH